VLTLDDGLWVLGVGLLCTAASDLCLVLCFTWTTELAAFFVLVLCEAFFCTAALLDFCGAVVVGDFCELGFFVAAGLAEVFFELLCFEVALIDDVFEATLIWEDCFDLTLLDVVFEATLTAEDCFDVILLDVVFEAALTGEDCFDVALLDVVFETTLIGVD